jgi:hypothetical protein
MCLAFGNGRPRTQNRPKQTTISPGKRPRSLAFYEVALRPLNIKFFLPYKREGDHPDLWGFGDDKRAFF